MLLPLPHYCGIGELPSATSASQTNDSLTWEGQDYRVSGLKVPEK